MILRHNFREQPDGPEAEAFREWLEHETIGMLSRCTGDPEGLNTTIFLYTNRAFESHMPEEEIGSLFGKCFVRSGLPEAVQDAAFDLLEFHGHTARQVHNRPRRE